MEKLHLGIERIGFDFDIDSAIPHGPVSLSTVEQAEIGDDKTGIRGEAWQQHAICPGEVIGRRSLGRSTVRRQ